MNRASLAELEAVATWRAHRCEHVVGSSGDRFMQATQQDRALGRRGARHRWEGALCRGNCEVDIMGVGEANLADLFLGRGIEQRRTFLAVRRDERSVDVDRVDDAHGVTPSHHYGERYALCGMI